MKLEESLRVMTTESGGYFMQLKCHKNDLKILFAIVFAKLLQLLLKIIKNCTLAAGGAHAPPA
jgi:hypothetical protein